MTRLGLDGVIATNTTLSREGLTTAASTAEAAGAGGLSGKPLGRRILRSERDAVNDYNTYTKTGLPAGPIANPGRASLEAAANPARTKELFFVADGSGGHVFADTYEAHQRNVARLRVIEQQAQPRAPRASGAKRRIGVAARLASAASSASCL